MTFKKEFSTKMFCASIKGKGLYHKTRTTIYARDSENINGLRELKSRAWVQM